MKKWIMSPAVAAVPVLSLLLFAVIHRQALDSYVYCESKRCEPVDVKNILLAQDPIKAPAKDPTKTASLSFEFSASPTPAVPTVKESKVTAESAGDAETRNKDAAAQEERKKKESAEADELARKKTIAAAEGFALKYSGRLYFAFLEKLYLGVGAIAFIVGCGVLYLSIARLRVVWLLAAIGMAALVGLMLCRHPETHMGLLLQFGPLTIQKEISTILTDIARANSFVFAVGVFLSLSTGAVLYLANTAGGVSGLKQLATRMKYLKANLYVSTVILVVGIILERALFQWTLAFIWRDERLVKAAENFLANVLAVDGGYFTLLLAMVYLPAFVILRKRAELLLPLPEEKLTSADLLLPLPERKLKSAEVLKKYGLDFSFTDSLPRVLAILAPLLAGPIGELFARLAK
jgi:hypothetical protein